MFAFAFTDFVLVEVDRFQCVVINAIGSQPKHACTAKHEGSGSGDERPGNEQKRPDYRHQESLARSPQFVSMALRRPPA